MAGVVRRVSTGLINAPFLQRQHTALGAQALNEAGSRDLEDVLVELNEANSLQTACSTVSELNEAESPTARAHEAALAEVARHAALVRERTELIAKARVTTFLLYHLVTSPVAFIIRYIDKGFLTTYLHLRARWLIPKIVGHFVLILGVLPWCYFQALPYSCTKQHVRINATEATLQGEDCGAEDFLKSFWSLLFGPLSIIPASVVCYRNMNAADHPLTDRFLLKAQKYLPTVPFSGLGPWFRAGTGGMAAQGLVPGYRDCAESRRSLEALKKEGGFGYHWMHDYLGAVDVIMLISVMNITTGVLIAVGPGLFPLFSNWDFSFDALQAAAKRTGIGFAAALVIVRILFHAADFVFGAPDRLAKAAAGVLMATDFQNIPNLKPAHKERRNNNGVQVTYADAEMSEELWDSLPSEANESAKKFVRDKLKEDALAEKVSEVPNMERVVPQNSTAGLLWHLYRDGGMSISMPNEHYEAFASLSEMGYIMAYADPEYETLGKHGFGRQFLTDTVYIHGRVLLMESNGKWRFKHTVEQV